MTASFKSSLLLVFAGLAFSSQLLADRSGGGGVGNGGGTWTCRDQDGALQKIQLVDLSESIREYGQPIPQSGRMVLPIPAPRDWFASKRPYLQWAESKIKLANPAFYAEYLRRKTDLLANRVLMPDHSQFDHTSDILHHTRPDDSWCYVGGHVPAQPEQLANFTLAGYLEINDALWNSPELSEVDRSALFVHEILYWIFRDLAGDTDSLRTRVIVGFLFSSTKPISEYASMLSLSPLPAQAQGVPLRYGMFAEVTGHWVDMEVNTYNATTRRLVLAQRDRDKRWAVKSWDTFECRPRGSEFQCAMIASTLIKPSGFRYRMLRIIDPSNFVWIRLKTNGKVDHATHYSKLP